MIIVSYHLSNFPIPIRLSTSLLRSLCVCLQAKISQNPLRLTSPCQSDRPVFSVDERSEIEIGDLKFKIFGLWTVSRRVV